MAGSAVEGEDFVGAEGVLLFTSGVLSLDIPITIINNMNAAGEDENLEVELYEIHPEGAKLGNISKTTITIADDDEFQEILDNMMTLTNENLASLSLYQSNWGKQFANAMSVNGGDVDTASASDFILHFLTFGLKVLFATAPPPGKGGGWPCFWVSLVYIGICACIISDLSKIFGCMIGLKEEIAAITLVTFGTSQIDLFASKIAAISDPEADNSIGNVVAANAIGVFLGLGFPFLVASLYWQQVSPAIGFVVPSESVSFMVGKP